MKTIKSTDGRTRSEEDSYVLEPGETVVSSSGTVKAPHVYKTTLAGDGSFYTWKEVDEKGELVRMGTQMFASEADAEKAIRTIAPSSDIVEVLNVKNINTEANMNVNLVRKEVVGDKDYGMNRVAKSVEIDQATVEETPNRVVHQNVAKTAEIAKAQEPLVEKLKKEAEEAKKIETLRLKKVEQERQANEKKVASGFKIVPADAVLA